jgi:hypothetical protein
MKLTTDPQCCIKLLTPKNDIEVPEKPLMFDKDAFILTKENTFDVEL